MSVWQQLPLGRKSHIKEKQRKREGVPHGIGGKPETRSQGDTDSYVKKYLQVFVHTCVLAVEEI